MKITHVLVVTALSVRAISISLAEEQTEMSRFPFVNGMDILYNYSDDLGSGTVGLGWDFDYSIANLFQGKGPDERDDPWAAFWETDASLKFSTSGAVLVDEDQNRTPIKADIGISLFMMFHPELEKTQTGGSHSGDSDFFQPSEPDDGTTASKSDEFSLRMYRVETNLETGFESDQAFDNSLFLLSLNNVFFNGYHGRQVKLTSAADYASVMMPTLEVALDGVLRNKSTVLDSGAESDEEYFRLRGAASWRYHVGQHFGKRSILLPLELYAVLQYSIDLDQNAGWKAAGQEESFGWMMEMTYDMPNLDQTALSGVLLFARFSDGRVAPILDDDRVFLMGIRKRF